MRMSAVSRGFNVFARAGTPCADAVAPTASKVSRAAKGSRTFDASLVRNGRPTVVSFRSLGTPGPGLQGKAEPDGTTRSLQLRAPIEQQPPQHRAMALRFVLAVAAHGKVRRMGQRGEQIDDFAVLRPFHLGFVFPEEGGEVARLHHELESGGSRCEVRQPDIEVHAALRLRHAARREPYRTDADAFPAHPFRPKPHHSDGHGFLCPGADPRLPAAAGVQPGRRERGHPWGGSITAWTPNLFRTHRYGRRRLSAR